MIQPQRLALSLLAVLVTASSTASAQSPSPAPQAGATDNRALAETLFFTARGLMEAGRYAEACAKLTESYRLDPAAGTLLNLGVCHRKSGKIASAWGELRESIAEARKAGRADREKLAAEAIAAIEPELPFLTLTVPDAVRKIPGLVISRNGVPLNAAAWNTELPVDPGDVEIEERAPEYKPRTLTIKMTNKQHASIAAEPLELAPILRAPPAFWTGQRTTGAVLFAGGVLAAGAGAIFGVVAINDKKSSDAACPNDAAGVQRCSQAGVSDMNSATTAAWVSDIGLGVGAIAGLVGAYLFAFGGEKSEAGPPAAGLSVQVGATPHGPTGLLTGSF